MADYGGPLVRAEQFVWLTARVLEQRRFAHLFLGGSAHAVEAALLAYSNDDGGFGHGLEPEVRGPVSQPAHAAAALRVLDEIGRCTGHRAERICSYLTLISNRDGAVPAVHPSIRNYPRAPWWPVEDNPPSALLTTGPIVGLLLRNDVWHAWLFRATDFCWSAVESLDKIHPAEAGAALAFLEGVRDREPARAELEAQRLGQRVREQGRALLDPARPGRRPVCDDYGPGEHYFAYDYATWPGSLARDWFTDDELERALDHLAAQQEDDGGWPARRPEWAPSARLERRPITTIEAIRTLQAYGRLGR